MSRPSRHRQSDRRPPAPRRWAASIAVAALTVGGLLTTSAPAAAASGPDGQQVSVSQSTGLDPNGHTLTVSGSGFDTSTGIYVALCVDNGAGQAPSPCVGGVDMEGAGGSSAWISSNPPAYGEGLAVPFTETGGRGSFSTSIRVAAADAFVDCLDPAQAPNGCVIGTRADHTRAGDRTADVKIPVSFATAGSATDAGGSTAEGGAAADSSADDSLASTGAPVAIAGGLAALLVAAGATGVLLRRRSTTHASGV